MSYTGEDGRDAQFRIMDQVKPQWRSLAIALKFPTYEITTMEHSDDPVYYLLSKWLEGVNKEADQRPVTWRTLIKSLRHANLQQEAAVLDEQCIIRKEATVLDEQCVIPKEVAVLDEQCMIPKEASQSGELHVH